MGLIPDFDLTRHTLLGHPEVREVGELPVRWAKSSVSGTRHRSWTAEKALNTGAESRTVDLAGEARGPRWGRLVA